MKNTILMLLYYILLVVGICCLLSEPDENSQTWFSDLFRSQSIGWIAVCMAWLIHRWSKVSKNNKTICSNKIRYKIREERKPA